MRLPTPPLLGLALVLASAGGLRAAPAAERAEQNGRVFYAAWGLVKDKYYDPRLHGVDWAGAHDTYAPEAIAAATDAELYRAINRMLSLLRDHHLVALSPRQAKERRTHQRLLVGLHLLKLEQGLAVSEVTPGSSADSAGVRPGWLLLTRNGVRWDQGSDFEPAAGQLVPFEFLDARDRRVVLQLAEGMQSTSHQEERRLSDGEIYLRFDAFESADASWLAKELRHHRSAPGVVVDLRSNGGGSVLLLEMVTGDFFDHKVECGELLSRAGKESRKNTWQFLSPRYAGRVSVLTGPASASCAEIFTAILQSRGRARVVGRKTAGAVEGAKVFSLPDGGKIEVAIDDYRLPDGRRLDGVGVTPDLTVAAPTLADLRAGRDRDLEAAIAPPAVPAPSSTL
ncbi:MAG TPA: S41 family peptidase [Opitutaceae bacterium]|nr:S41 family peptidase [Opitutaceae bacterium]